MSDQLWEARREAAKATLKKQHAFHVNQARDAKLSVIYMDACGIADDTHPAVVIVEESVFSGRQQEAMFHAKMAEKFAASILEIEALTITTKESN